MAGVGSQLCPTKCKGLYVCAWVSPLNDVRDGGWNWVEEWRTEAVGGAEITGKVWGISLGTYPHSFQMKFQTPNHDLNALATSPTIFPTLLPFTHSASAPLASFLKLIKLFPASGPLFLLFFLRGIFWTTQAKVLPSFILFHSYLYFSFTVLIHFFIYALFITLEGEFHEKLVSILLMPHPQRLAHCLAHGKWSTAVKWINVNKDRGKGATRAEKTLSKS